MEFNSDWLTLGRHRIRLRSSRGFPTETMGSVAEVVRLAIDNNMSARSALPWWKTAFVRRSWKRLSR
jgi:hypothetical protein